MAITEEQKKHLFAMGKDMRTRRDTMLSRYDQSKNRKEKDHFLSLSMVYAAGEHGIHSCFRTLGLAKEYADFIGESMEDFSDSLFRDAFMEERRFFSSVISYRNATHSNDWANKRQRCRECLAVYKVYLKVFAILDITGKYKIYKEH